MHLPKPHHPYRTLLCACSLALATISTDRAAAASPNSVVIEVEQSDVRLNAGTETAVDVALSGLSGQLTCLGSRLLLEGEEADLGLNVDVPRCATTGTLFTTLRVTAGSTVPVGTYQAELLATVALGAAGPIVVARVPIVILIACREFSVVQLTRASATVFPDMSTAARLSVYAIDPPNAVWTFASSDLVEHVSVRFSPDQIASRGETQARISVGPMTRPGRYPIRLVPHCNGVPVPMAFELTVLQPPTATWTPTSTASPTATSTASSTNSPTATEPPPTIVRDTPTPTPTASPTAEPTETVKATVTGTPYTPPSPPPPPPPTETDQAPDLWITAIELTQGIQNLANEAPLVAYKDGIVRVFVRRDPGPSVGPVTVKLRVTDTEGTREIAPLGQYATVTVSDRPVDVAMRSDLHQSVVFPMPFLEAGGVTFEATVNPDRSVQESDFQNNSRTESSEFHRTDLELTRVRIRARNGVTPALASWSRAVDAMHDVYPASTIRVRDRGIVDWTASLSDVAGADELLNQLWWWDLLDGGDDDEDAIWVAFIDRSVTNYNLNGVGAAGRAVVWGNEPHKLTLAHEVAHAMDRLHVNCGAPNAIDRGYPYDPERIASGEADGYFGAQRWARRLTATVDHQAGPRVIAPHEASDFMSYCNPRWVSDYTYRALFGAMRNRFGSSSILEDNEPHPAEGIAVTGIYDPATGSGRIEHTQVLAVPVAGEWSPPPSDLRIDAFDSRGRLLASSPVEFHTSDEGAVPFAAFVPANRPAQVVLSLGGQALDSVSDSGHSPRVVIKGPLGGEALDDRFTVAWSGGDVDRDDLSYTVLFSPDAGTSWRPLGINLSDSSLEVDATVLPGTETGMIRVLVSDGLRGHIAESPPTLAIPFKAPELEVISAGSSHLQALATDLEDGELDGSSVEWTSDLDGVVGTGSSLKTEVLGRGRHKITARVVDSSGMAATAYAEVRVGFTVVLPSVQTR